MLNLPILIISTIMGLLFAHVTYPIFENFTKSEDDKTSEVLDENLKLQKKSSSKSITHHLNLNRF